MDRYSPSTDAIFFFVGLLIALLTLMISIVLNRRRERAAASLSSRCREAVLRFGCLPSAPGRLRFVLENVAEQEARNVSLDVVEGREFFEEAAMRLLFPLQHLGPRERATLPGWLLGSGMRMVRVSLSWDDEAGLGRRAQHVVRIA